jgi:hypothetical protein
VNDTLLEIKDGLRELFHSFSWMRVAGGLPSRARLPRMCMLAPARISFLVTDAVFYWGSMGEPGRNPDAGVFEIFTAPDTEGDLDRLGLLPLPAGLP